MCRGALSRGGTCGEERQEREERRERGARSTRECTSCVRDRKMGLMSLQRPFALSIVSFPSSVRHSAPTYQCKNIGFFPFNTRITVSINSNTFETVNSITHIPAAPSPYPAVSGASQTVSLKSLCVNKNRK